MYRVLILCALFGALRAEEPCSCDQVTNDIEDLRRFLLKPEKVQVSLSVLPGELSPYFCNCNKFRQRRSDKKVHPKLLVAVQTQNQETGTTPEALGSSAGPTRTPEPFFNSSVPAKPFFSSTQRPCAEQKPRLGPYRCPSGYIRKGFHCIPLPCQNK